MTDITGNIDYNLPCVLNTIWISYKPNREEREHLIEGEDYLLNSGNVSFRWKDVVHIDQIPRELMRFIGYDITKFTTCTLINLRNGKWFYALVKFSDFNKAWSNYIIWMKEERAKKQFLAKGI